MTTVTLSRRFSGFTNVADTWIIGDDDAHAGTVAEYRLPEGYRLGSNHVGDPAIVDPEGYVCEIRTHSTGRPQIQSLSGSIAAQPVLAVAN